MEQALLYIAGAIMMGLGALGAAIGIGVLGGVVTSTFLVTLFAPLFYVLIYRAMGKHRQREKAVRVETQPSGNR